MTAPDEPENGREKRDGEERPDEGCEPEAVAQLQEVAERQHAEKEDENEETKEDGVVGLNDETRHGGIFDCRISIFDWEREAGRQRSNPRQLQVVAVGEGNGSDGDSKSYFGGVNGAGCVRMLGQFFGDGFRELRADMPEKGMAPRAEQAHEPVTDENDPLTL